MCAVDSCNKRVFSLKTKQAAEAAKALRLELFTHNDADRVA